MRELCGDGWCILETTVWIGARGVGGAGACGNADGVSEGSSGSGGMKRMDWWRCADGGCSSMRMHGGKWQVSHLHERIASTVSTRPAHATENQWMSLCEAVDCLTVCVCVCVCVCVFPSKADNQPIPHMLCFFFFCVRNNIATRVIRVCMIAMGGYGGASQTASNHRTADQISNRALKKRRRKGGDEKERAEAPGHQPAPLSTA
jgi:hypothetical protein